MHTGETQEVRIDTTTGMLPGSLTVVQNARGLVVFAHGSGSSRFSTRNQAVARYLEAEGFSTLLFDLLTPEEDRDYENRFDLDLLTQRLVDTMRWAARHADGADGAPIGVFGASTGAAAALRAAVELGPLVQAVVSRGGRPDMAAAALARVRAPTLLIVGGADTEVLALNRAAKAQLPNDTVSRLEVIPGATHLFEEAGAMNRVAALAAGWFRDHLRRAAPQARRAG
jgi:putative phosphoribosyl transferase